MDKVTQATQHNLDASRMPADIVEEIIMETVDNKLWVTSRRRRHADNRAILRSIHVYNLFPTFSGV